jgi:NodT family efflux transporter outer membrane factor (OMF) lipoprotein
MGFSAFHAETDRALCGFFTIFMRGRWCLGLLLVAMLKGCTVGPDFHSPGFPDVGSYLPGGRTSGLPEGERVPGQNLVRGADISARWWALFRSENLNRLVEDGIGHNADLQAAAAAVRVAQASALAQRSTMFPVVTGSFESTRQQVAGRSVTSDAASGSDLFSLHTAQLSVSFVPDIFGGKRRQFESADALAEREGFRLEGVYLTLTSNIALTAIREAALRGQVGATRRMIDLQLELLKILQRQHELGQLGQTEIAAQETSVAQTRLLLPPLERQLAQQRHLLAFLTGRVPSQGPAENFQLSSFRLPRDLPLSLPADLVRNRPDIRAAEANLRSANAEIGVAIANRLPQVTITGNAGSVAESISKLFSPGTAFWMVAGNAAQTIFDAGNLRYRQRAAEAATEQAAAEYRSVVLASFQNMADVLRALQADARAISAATTAERAASRNIDLVRQQVQEGQVSVPLLLVVQQAYLQAQLARIEAEASRLANTVALFQALGGGWWNRPPPPAPEEASHHSDRGVKKAAHVTRE